MMPNNTLSVTPVPSFFLAPRTNIRFSAAAGSTDVHYGGIAIGDPSHGLQYQLWTCFTDGNNVYLSAPNTPAFIQLPNVGAKWVALAFDQNARVFIAYANASGVASYYWFNSLINNYQISTLSGVVPRVFAMLDDARPALINSSDVLFAYVRSGTLFMRQQRDRFAVEYTLGAAPATLVQMGMNHVLRLQFAFQNVQGDTVLPPAEWAPPAGLSSNGNFRGFQ